MTNKSIDDISKELEAQMGEDNDDDYFETVLKQELETPTDDDEDTDTSKDKVAEEESEDEPKVTKPSYEELESKLAEMEKAAKGRLNDTVKSRQEKAQIKSELEELRTAVSKLLEQRNNAAGEGEEETEDIVDLKKRGIEFDEDDKAYVDLSPIEKKIEAENKKTREELDEIKAERAREEAIKKFNDQVNNIVNEDETFTQAYDDLKVAFKDLNDAVIQIQNRLEIWDENGAIDQDQALDLLSDSDELKEWNKAHPGIDPIRIARAFNSKVDLRSSLRDIANAKGYSKSGKAEVDLDEKIKRAKEKPGSHGDSSDKAGSQLDLIDRIAQLNSEDLLNISDAEAERITAMLRNQELKGE